MMSRAKKIVETTQKIMQVQAIATLLASKPEKKICPDCTNYEKDPEYAGYSSKCPECEKRMLKGVVNE